MENIIRDIAKNLSFNYLQASLKDKYINNRENNNGIDKNLCEIFFSKEFIDDVAFPDRDRYRNILVLGSGATYDSFEEIPLRRQAVIDLIRKYQLKEPKDKESGVNKYVEVLALDHNKRKELEKILDDHQNLDDLYKNLDVDFWLKQLKRMYSDRFIQKFLRDFIKDYYNYRHLPTLKYEIISHLFKHRFIDVIINFSFDEILEQDIEEELGKGNYVSIESEADCRPINELMINKRLRVPLYFKPYGKASYQDVVKFNENHHIEISDGIIRLIKQMAMGRVSDESDKKISEINEVNMIVVGFGMKNKVFNKLLEEAGQKVKLNMYHIKKHKGATSKIANINEKPCYLNEKNLDELFHEIWEEVRNNFKDPYKPRTIARHRVIYELFYKKEFGPGYNSKSRKSSKVMKNYF